MSGYQMFLPVKPDGTIMEMFPLRDPDLALVAAAHFMPQSMSGEELRKSSELAPACWRAAGGGWGFSDTLAVEMAKAFGYTTVEVFLHPSQGKPKVELPKVREFIDFILAYREKYQLQVPFSSLEMTMFKLADTALSELDAAEGRK